MWRKGNPFALLVGMQIGANADWYSHCGKQHGVSSKKLKMDLPYDPVIPLLGICHKNLETAIQKNLCTPTFLAVLLTIAKI